MQSRRTLTLTLFQREREPFGGTVPGSPNSDPQTSAFELSSPRSERGEDQGEGRFRLHTYGLEGPEEIKEQPVLFIKRAGGIVDLFGLHVTQIDEERVVGVIAGDDLMS